MVWKVNNSSVCFGSQSPGSAGSKAALKSITGTLNAFPVLISLVSEAATLDPNKGRLNTLGRNAVVKATPLLAATSEGHGNIFKCHPFVNIFL